MREEAESTLQAAAAEGPNWEIVAEDYKWARLTIPAICRKHGITANELLQRAARNKWKTLRDESTDRTILIGMLLGALEQQIGHLEGIEMTQSGEKEVAVLGKLASTLEKLIDIEDRAKPRAGSAVDMQEIRNKLAQRIENLQRK